MTQQLVDSIESMREEFKKLSLGIVELRKDVESIKIANRKLSSVEIPGLSGGGNWDWARISEEAISGIDPLILPTNTARETLSSTIDALKSKPAGATADEISQITGRARNTESAYLRRLHLAGKVEKTRKGKKVKYNLSKNSL